MTKRDRKATAARLEALELEVREIRQLLERQSQPTASRAARPKMTEPARGRSGPIPRRRIYPIAEAAELLGVHRTTLYNRHREGLVSLVRMGSRTYVAADELERYVRETAGDGAGE
jgi:excisionase family DNA binding protein